MDILKKNLKFKFFTPARISLLVLVLAMVSSWQQVRMHIKDRTIAKLIRENADLKRDLSDIDDQLFELKETASDVRLFQHELVKVIKDIDQNYPVSLGNRGDQAHGAFGQKHKSNSDLALINSGENIFKLSSSQENLRFQTASLLGRAVSIRDFLFKTPSMMPVGNGYISSDFGLRLDPFTKKYKMHYGIDVAAPLGEPVVAAADGRVKSAMRNRTYGNIIELDHADGTSTSYAHLSEILVSKNQMVKRGEKIGRVGKTGTRCQGSHVHVELKKNGIRQDPKRYLVTSPPTFF